MQIDRKPKSKRKIKNVRQSARLESGVVEKDKEKQARKKERKYRSQTKEKTQCDIKNKECLVKLCKY